ncbi:isoleucine--tRNA ligase [Demequina sp. SYSU T00039]|uniref:Isoleucine--tRNA ligase n=1 Tax=Demequina lignilytica TaxID=3051663 RepID=A0AAW7M498_9MICO|nr:MULTISPECIES: isoleucine--tRNA ligase [unclassified Demequina]MDN4477239.1 isoleucine--tRNA ligase [Demequina sp. SYSU T00039-1]MDN4487412.1 isoleucine--tRNA ligase [Demequina sp. SYSU T00039]MDN4491165.1 isoleucine--tRNA ligase [Demequina sp. SYSU T00068]
MTDAARYPLHRTATDPTAQVAPSPHFPEIESDVLAYWEADQTFQASVDNRPARTEAGNNEFVFYDGPPFANGLPHYGHLLTGYAKDVVPRFETMRGRRVERRFGWDTHGLPAELEAERILGITDKAQIEEMGIAAFNEACESSVLKYTKEWEAYVTRQARWVDFENDYKTLDVTFMESVIWAFKSLYDKGLAYEGFRVLPYCWRDETPLSNHELRMDDDVYQSRQDPTLAIFLPLTAESVAASSLPAEAKEALTGAAVTVWTTTPWTLPSNLAAAVGPEIEYAVVRPTGGAFAGTAMVLAVSRLAYYGRELGEGFETLVTLTGADLAGLGYEPPFPHFRGQPNAHRILAADYVTTEDGTGIVHLAPAFGEEDMAVCQEAGIEPVIPIDAKGRFTSEVPEYAGQQVFDTNPAVIKDLKEAGVVLRHETYEHPYPHCWRCRNPLIYRAVGSWFVRVTEFRDRMVELNEDITWVPEHIKHGQFGKWLEGARDWSISRNRYFGTPIPVWVSDDPAFPRTDVYGSLEELERDFGRLPLDAKGEPNLHRPFIDDLTRPNPDDPSGNATMRRIPDVFDVWFDSGSMPFAQVHYPFENRDWFDGHNPADFIVEYIGQTRGWFYVMHVLATALFDRPAFKTCVSHGIVLGSDGRKMSKSLRNYPDVNEVFHRDGSDAMRWFLMSSPILRGGNLIVTEEGIREGVRQVLLPLWSTYYFFTLYAGAANGGAGARGRLVDDAAVESLPVMDRYVLAKTAELVRTVTAQMEVFDVPGASESLRQFMELLTNWYVRTQRDRFWQEDQAAFDTLFTVLVTVSRLAAPLLPLATEEIYRGLTGERSVHLTDYPTAPAAWDDASLGAVMDQVREVVSTAHALRKKEKIRVRQPLSLLKVAVSAPEALEAYGDLIASELNVKSVAFVTEDAFTVDHPVERRLTVNARAAGPRIGKDVQAAIRGSKTGDWSEAAGEVVSGGIALVEGEYEVATVIGSGADDAAEAASVLPAGGFVLIDTAITPELEAEGYARDLVRAIQDERKNAGLNVADRIVLTLTVPAERVAAVEAHRELIAGETLAAELAVVEGEQAIAVAKA